MCKSTSALILCLLLAGCAREGTKTAGTGPAARVTVNTKPEKFLFGASVYPELQTREEWNRMLDVFQKAGFTAVRVSESSWGNLETGPGKYNFGWLKDFLDDLHKRGMKAILGTSSYIAPQWLVASDPEMLEQERPGVPTHPMSRKAASLCHPKYLEAVRRYCQAIGGEFKDHSAVIGWQLDNEIEFMVGRIDYSSAARKAWTAWLKKEFKTAEEFNRRLRLESWGMKVDSLDHVPLPTVSAEGGQRLPAISLAHLHFRRDVILDFFQMQTQALREAGVKHWITTDWNAVWPALADDPKARESLDIAGINFYQPSLDQPDYWTTTAWHFDMHRAAHGLGRFISTETRVGVAGSVIMWDPFPTKEQFRMWMFQPVAYGSAGILYWTGNRWRGGHWPHWGGVLDWTGRPEPDAVWLSELGEFFSKWSQAIVDTSVKAQAVMITDFDQRAALDIYQHVPTSAALLPDAFDMLHRSGIGVDSLGTRDAALAANLKKYALVVVPAATALDGKEVPTALRQFVEDGGNVLVTPFTAYMDRDGIFRGDGFGANLKELTGVVAPTARRLGSTAGPAAISGPPELLRRMGGQAHPARGDQMVKWTEAWLGGPSPAGMEGFIELLEVDQGVEIIGQFQSDDPLLNGRPAATRKRTGKGAAIKLAFWPKDDSVARLMRQLAAGSAPPLSDLLPHGVQAVPRTDGTLWVINTTSKPAAVSLAKGMKDRISGKPFQGKLQLGPYGTLWLE